MALIFVCSMYGTGVALVVHEQRVRLCCFVCALELEWRVYWRSMQYDEVILATSYAISLSTYTIYNNGDDGFLLIFVRWTYVTGVVLSMDKQAVRWPCCVCVHSNLTVLLVFDAVCDCNVILIIYTHLNGNDGLRWSLFSECMESTGVVLLAVNQQYVRLYYCVCLNLKVLDISFWHSMRL